MKRVLLLSLTLQLLCGIAPGQPGGANSISFQGALNGPTGQPLPNGNYNLTFRFWDGPAPGGNPVSTNIPMPNVPVAGGVVSTAIPVEPAWFNGQTRYLGVSVNGGSELLPRVLVTAVPYAIFAEKLAPGTVDGSLNVAGRFSLFGPSEDYLRIFKVRDPFGPAGMAGMHLGLISDSNQASVSASINGGIYDPTIGLPPTVGQAFFKIGGTHHNSQVDPVSFNAGSIALEVESKGPGYRYASALRFRTLADSYSDNIASEKMAITGNGDVIIGNWQDFQNRRLVLRGPNRPENSGSHQDISFQFAAAGEAVIRGYRGASWDTYLEFWTSDYSAGPNNHQRQMMIDSGGVTVFGTARTTILQITSDRNAKQDFQPVDNRDVLAKVVALPITTWSHTNSSGVRHLGPMAQDFHAAFGLGDSDKHIGLGDEAGVALAAIQALRQLLDEKDTEIARLQSELHALGARTEQRLAALEASLGMDPASARHSAAQTAKPSPDSP